jgi:hypothetical protein
MNPARIFAARDFEHLGTIDIERGKDGEVLTFMPQTRYTDASTVALHAYGGGPFCRFRIGRKRHDPGLYVLTLNDVLVYAGECVHVGKRWGPNGYGGISPRNCFHGGQPTNCRVNAAILTEALQGSRIDLWFAAFHGPRTEPCRRNRANPRAKSHLEPSKAATRSACGQDLTSRKSRSLFQTFNHPLAASKAQSGDWSGYRRSLSARSIKPFIPLGSSKGRPRSGPSG